MKYMILIHSNPATRSLWESFAEEQRAEEWRVYAKLAEDLAASGELIVTEALADASTAKRVTVQDGRIGATDGPFAEAKEHLAGFILLDCEDMDRAIEWAGRVPEAEYGVVEVRPVMELGGFEV